MRYLSEGEIEESRSEVRGFLMSKLGSSLGAFHTTFSGTMPLTSKDCDKGDVCGVL